jgi:hypothetical protein
MSTNPGSDMLSSKSIGSVHGGAREPAAYRKTQASHLLVESILGNTLLLDAWSSHAGVATARRRERQSSRDCRVGDDAAVDGGWVVRRDRRPISFMICVRYTNARESERVGAAAAHDVRLRPGVGSLGADSWREAASAGRSARCCEPPRRTTVWSPDVTFATPNARRLPNRTRSAGAGSARLGARASRACRGR